jgi:hypothetical protein
MAGSLKDDTHFVVPCAALTLKKYENPIATEPLYFQRLKFGGANCKIGKGDTSSCATTFLNLILHWFVEVLVQDGAFFITKIVDVECHHHPQFEKCSGEKSPGKKGKLVTHTATI